MERHRHRPSRFALSPIRFAAIALALFLTACGGGGGGGGSPTPTDPWPSALPDGAAISAMTPDNGGGLYADDPTLIVVNADPGAFADGVYGVEIYTDALMNDPVLLIGGLAEEADGSLAYAIDNVVEAGRAYYWRFSARYRTAAGEVTVTSGLARFFVSSASGGMMVSPRSGGYLDRWLRATPTLTVGNGFSDVAEASAAYEFEIYAGAGLAGLVATGIVDESTDDRYTTWTGETPLDDGAEYYWRVRGVVNGKPMGWRTAHSFTVADPCGVSGSRYASYVTDTYRARDCSSLAMNDASKALGAPDATSDPYANFYSLDFGGEILLEMGSTVVDWPGYDLRVYEFVSSEFLEVLVGPTATGPWVSLGTSFCPDYCDFDLGAAGVRYARFVRVRDIYSLAGPCHATAGADIDAVVALQPGNSGQCSAGWR